MKEQIKQRQKDEKDKIKQKEKDEKERLLIDKKLHIDSLEKTKADLASKNRPENRFVADDNACAILILEELKPVLISYKRRVYFKVDNVWIYNINFITEHIKKFIMTSSIYRENKDSNLIPYGQNINTAKNVCEAVLIKVKLQPDTCNIYQKFHSTTKGRLCFKDGVLDFKAKKFYKWNEINFEYYTTVMINYELGDYITNPKMEIVNEIKMEE